MLWHCRRKDRDMLPSFVVEPGANAKTANVVQIKTYFDLC